MPYTHCKLSSVRSLSKASNEGDLRENMAKADIRTSLNGISGSPFRCSGMGQKTSCTERNRASAHRCLRTLGTTIPMATSNQKWSHSCPESHILAWWFTNRQVGMPDECLLLRVFGNCCSICQTLSLTAVGPYGEAYASMMP